MIQPQELRIGNYVFDIDGDILQIGEILDVGVRFKNTSLASRYEKINPIPLTEEWLLRFGFFVHNKTMYPNNFTKGIFELEKHYNFFRLEGINRVIELKYIHQLQNLYFALTGEELTQVSEGENKNFV